MTNKNPWTWVLPSYGCDETENIKEKYAVITNMNDSNVAVRVGSEAWCGRQPGFAVYGFDDLKSARDLAKCWNDDRRSVIAKGKSSSYGS